MRVIQAEIDFSFEHNFEAELKASIGRRQLAYRVINNEGPGGWPVVRITGSKRSVMSYLKKYAPDLSEKDIIDLYFLPVYKKYYA